MPESTSLGSCCWRPQSERQQKMKMKMTVVLFDLGLMLAILYGFLGPTPPHTRSVPRPSKLFF